MPQTDDSSRKKKVKDADTLGVLYKRDSTQGEEEETKPEEPISVDDELPWDPEEPDDDTDDDGNSGSNTQ